MRNIRIEAFLGDRGRLLEKAFADRFLMNTIVYYCSISPSSVFGKSLKYFRQFVLLDESEAASVSVVGKYNLILRSLQLYIYKPHITRRNITFN
jgi:hypothetical protein